jgi:hypothetical protein
MLIGNIENRAGHGKRTVDSEGEYMGSVAHEEVVKFNHNNQELGGLILQRQKLDTSSTCLLVICYLAALLFGKMNVLHTRIKLVIDVIRGTGAPSWLNLFFNGPRSTRFLIAMMQKLSHHLLRTSFHYHLAENWMNGELQRFYVIWRNVDALYVCQGGAQPIFSWLVFVGNSSSISLTYH